MMCCCEKKSLPVEAAMVKHDIAALVRERQDWPKPLAEVVLRNAHVCCDMLR